MLRRSFWSGLFALCAVVVLLSDVRAATGGTMAQITATITLVRNGKTADIRVQSAERLAKLTRGVDPKTVDDRTVNGLVSLLDTSDDAVRFWVATAIGNLGPRAKAAIPALKKILPEADCLNGALTSAVAIRQALRRLGTVPPPRPNCPRIAG